MKITISQLRRIISEEVQIAREAKSIGALHGVRLPSSLKLKLGDIYRNPKGNQISIEFLDGEFAGWELMASGVPKSVYGSTKELKSVLMDGGFEFDRNETAY